MKTSIVVLPGESENIVRERITAARQAAECPDRQNPVEIWWFNPNIQDAEQLPAETVICFPVQGKAIADCYLPMVKSLTEERKPDLVLFGSRIVEKDLCAALACSVNGACALGVTGITAVPGNGEGFRITRFVQGMQLEGAFLYTHFPMFFSLDKGSFSPLAGSGKPALSVKEFPIPEQNWFEDYSETVIEEDVGLSQYDAVFAGGRGLGSKDAAADLMELGRILNFGVGASRPAVLNAWMPLNRMIGISGYTLNPKLCVNFGISGCAPFIHGIEKSNFMISVNNDPDAAVFRYSDLGLAADCNEAVRFLLKRVKGEKNGTISEHRY